MHCYICLVETGCLSHAAVALCQRCGAGVCDTHLLVLEKPPVVGMAGDGQHRRHLICSHCSQRLVTSPQQEPQPQRQPSRGKRFFWQWWKRRREHALPEPEEAVAAVEQWLKSRTLDSQDHSE